MVKKIFTSFLAAAIFAGTSIFNAYAEQIFVDPNYNIYEQDVAGELRLTLDTDLTATVKIVKTFHGGSYALYDKTISATDDEETQFIFKLEDTDDGDDKVIASYEISILVPEYTNSSRGLTYTLDDIRLLNPAYYLNGAVKYAIYDWTLHFTEEEIEEPLVEIEAPTYDDSNVTYKQAITFYVRKALKGDVDGNGVVDGSDAAMVLNHYARISTSKPGCIPDSMFDIADVDRNKVIDAVDASKILKYYGLVMTGKTPDWDLI